MLFDELNHTQNSALDRIEEEIKERIFRFVQDQEYSLADDYAEFLTLLRDIRKDLEL